MDKIEVTQWRKKPVVVEAMEYPGRTATGVDTLTVFEAWIDPLAKAAGRWPLTYRGQSLIIPTLEGDHEAKPGDYIIRGVSGEIYPCKPDIFAKTYEPALATRTDATPVAVEMVAELQLSAFLAGRGSIRTKANGNTHESSPGPTMDDYRRMARFALNSTLGCLAELVNHPSATDVAALVEAAKAIMPIRVHNGPDYAEVYFADGTTHSTHAMTMNPQDWLDLSAALAPFTKGQNDE